MPFQSGLNLFAKYSKKSQLKESLKTNKNSVILNLDS
jgi:hypothetical protein